MSNDSANSRELSWDLSTTEKWNTFPWPENAANHDVYTEEGDIKIDIALPGDRHLRGSIRSVSFTSFGPGDRLNFVDMKYAQMTLMECVDLAQQLAKQLGVDDGSLQAWRTGASDKSNNFFFSNNESLPTIAIRIYHSYDVDRPWYVGVDIGWPIRPWD